MCVRVCLNLRVRVHVRVHACVCVCVFLLLGTEKANRVLKEATLRDVREERLLLAPVYYF